jgi:hypothetical protein
MLMMYLMHMTIVFYVHIVITITLWIESHPQS